jgi:hypothetical protein
MVIPLRISLLVGIRWSIRLIIRLILIALFTIFVEILEESGFSDLLLNIQSI